ncbi:ABC transporter permease [Pararhodobacter zhoushanensis]|uniref:Iron chelate uptake ABC transporter family permease subunit n=1 Tax=Pararhodobacter zhoushanensis TaxID=2479545 RepID=A0ABT3GV66_9RHOB|nr:iron chelate uptake ABC transporter family permease subunit [Pararhodobacter zhoushanensis]MCW1931431.1 iron chelate uptake ABC transporter family permease subunit [Pararhodobacter zhoushanensis]
MPEPRLPRPPSARAALVRLIVPLALATTLGLGVASLFVGVSAVSPALIWAERGAGPATEVLLTARLPRTLALALAGMGLALAGLVLQVLVRNRFVEPSTVGTTESASLGILMVMLFAPGMPVAGRMAVAAFCGLAGTMLFLLLLRAVPRRSALMVPLLGLLLSGVIGAVTTFIAYRTDMLQSLGAWSTGDFSMVLAGRYEGLWIVAILAALTALFADQITVAGLGRDMATGLGVNHRAVRAAGVLLVALLSAAVIVTVGMIPFLGLVVPNIVSLLLGDNLRRTLPVVCLSGAALVMACDIAGRLVVRPYEMPIGLTMGIVGSGLFLWLLTRSRRHDA